MGNANTIIGDQQLPINFKQLRRQQHSILGNIRFIQNSYDSKHYILVQKTFASQIQYQKCLKKLKNRIKLSKMQRKYLPNEYILQILEHRNNQYTQICGKTFKIFIFIKQFDTNLKNIFLQKLNNHLKFSEQQLLQLILKITNCLIELYDHNIKPFHLSMQSIVFENNKCKVIDTDLATKINPIDSFNYRAELRKGTFIAPELLSAIDNRQNYIYNSSKCDIFTLGIIILQLATNTFLDNVYDYSHRRINFNKIQSLIQSIQFSQFFKQTLKQMLAADQSQRIGILRLKQNIKNRTKDLFQSSRKLSPNNKIQTYGPLSNAPKFVLLGKRISQRQKDKKQRVSQKNQSHLNTHKQIQISQNNSNLNANYSYHMLHNNKIQNRSKKSISFGSQMSFSNINRKNDLHNSPSLIQNSVLDQFPQNQHLYNQITRKTFQFNNLTNYDQKLQSNFNYYPQNVNSKKPQQPQSQDLSDNRSDKPISPITYQSKDKLQSRKDSLIIHQIDKKKLSKPYYQFIKDFQFSNLHISSPLNKKLNQNQRIQDKFIRQFPTNQQFPFHKKQKLQIKDKEYQTYRTQKSFIVKQFSGNNDIQLQKDKFNFNYTPLNTFNILPASKQSQRPYFNLQNTDFSTPRMEKVDSNKNNQDYLISPQVKVKIIPDTQSKKSYSLQRQTPIKSLQLLQTIQKKSNLKQQVPNQNKKIFGRYDFSNGSTYQGEFNQKNQFQGNGVLYFPSGKVFYSGCWKANQFHGFGILNNFQSDIPIDFKKIVVNYKDFNLNDNNLWTQYEGEFCQDKKHGFGTLFFVNGDKFSGCFVRDSIQGYGNFYQANFSKTIMGIWNNNFFYQP